MGHDLREKEVITMTNREFYSAIINASISDEITAHAEAALTKLDETNVKRAAKQAEKSAENMTAIKAVVAELTDKPQTATDMMGVTGESVQKTSYYLRTAAKMGLCEVTDVKVAKKGTQKGYFVVPGAATEAAEAGE
jgi:ATP/maltotriose-dependent transcriptional regulator MalT